MKRNQGFTLLEMLIVIIIIGVLAIIALTSYQSLSERSRKAEARETIAGIRQAEWTVFHMTQKFTSDWKDLEAYINVPPIDAECKTTHWFSYGLGTDCPAGLTEPCYSVTAKRCATGGKEPNSQSGESIFFAEDSNGSQTDTADTGGGPPGGPRCCRWDRRGNCIKKCQIF